MRLKNSISKPIIENLTIILFFIVCACSESISENRTVLKEAHEDEVSSAQKKISVNPFPFPTSCGRVRVNSRIISGISLKHLPHSWVVAILTLQNPQDDVVQTKLCTGTIVHERFVITSASCLANLRHKASRFRIGFDTPNITTLLSGDSMQEILADFDTNIFIHPKFKPIKNKNNEDLFYLNDLALLKLHKPTSLQAVCMPLNSLEPNSYPHKEQILTMYSWGKPGQGKEYPDLVAGTKFRSLDIETCFNAFLHRSFDHSKLFCAKNNKLKTCSYIGDSGAGLYTYERGFAVLAGIIATNRDTSCQKPEVAQRITAYIGWIRSVILSN